MMGRLAISHGALGDLPNHCRVGIGKSHLRQRGRQSHPVTEPEHILHLVGRASLHHQLHHQAERHLLAVKELMGRRSHRQAVVHLMSDRKAARFETESRQECIGFHDAFERRRYDLPLDGRERIGAVRD